MAPLLLSPTDVKYKVTSGPHTYVELKVNSALLLMSPTDNQYDVTSGPPYWRTI